MLHFTILCNLPVPPLASSLQWADLHIVFHAQTSHKEKDDWKDAFIRLEPQSLDGWLLVHSSKMSLCSPLRVMAHSKRPSPVLPHWCCTTVKATPLSVIIDPHREWSAWRLDRSKSINDIKEIKGRLQLEQRWIDSVQKRQILKKFWCGVKKVEENVE